MQQLKIEHKKSNSNKNQRTEQTEEMDLREKKVRALISRRRFYRLENSNIFYIESSKDIIFIIADIPLDQKEIIFVHANFSSSEDIRETATI